MPRHATARRCVFIAIPLMAIGVVMLAHGPDLYAWISDVVGFNAEAGLFLVSLVLTIAQWALIPTAASLIGAAVVIEALSRDRAEPPATTHDEEPRA